MKILMLLISTNTQLLIQRSLTPAKISYMELDNEKKHAEVYLKAEPGFTGHWPQGRKIKLACELTGYN